MDDEFVITMTVDSPNTYSLQIGLEDSENAMFMDFLVLHLTGDVTLSYWFEESNDGMTWKEKDRIDGESIFAGAVGKLTSSVLGGVLVRAGFAIVDAGGGGLGDVTLRISLHPFRR